MFKSDIPISIRKITINEINTLVNISQQTYSETFFEVFDDPEGFAAYVNEMFAPEKLRLEVTDANSAFYFALIGEQVVGYIKLNFEDNISEIEHLYVIKTYHKQKVGKALVDEAVKIATDLELSFLWLAVWEHNKQAIIFYKRYGFEQFDTREYEIAGDTQTDLLLRFPVLA